MNGDPVRGKSVRWTYEDGPVKGKHFEHTFAGDGSVTWREVGGRPGEGEPSAKYQAMWIAPDVYLVAYLAASGWALTTTVETKTGKIVSVASNEKQLVVQHGSLE
jgi:molybdenum cofactor biosynthesis protein MoaF